MASSQTFVWDYVFDLDRPIVNISQKTTNFLSKKKFNGESEIPIVDYLFKFIKKCTFGKITDNGALCRLFTLTFIGRIKKWFDAFMTKSFHSWEQFMELFLLAHHKYDYGEVIFDHVE